MDVYGRPARRQRILSEVNRVGDQQLQGLAGVSEVAPAKPLLRQQPTQQGQCSWLPAGAATRLNFAAADANGTEMEEFEHTSTELATEKLPTSRWLACCYKAGQLGVAAYDRLSNELSVMQVPDDNKGALAFQMLHYVKLQANPQVIVLPATAEAVLLEAAQAPAAVAAGVATDGDCMEEVVVQLQRPSIFTLDKALKMLSAISLRQQHTAGRPINSTTAAADCINLGAQQQVAALGALVAVLLQAQQDEEGTDGVLLVDRLTEMKLDGHLLVDGPSLAALDVFKEEEHPSVMGIGTSKEGVSVYGLLQRCVTAMGKRLLRQWFLRPVVHMETLASRHDTIELLLAAPDTNEHIRAALRKVGDLPRLLAQLRLSQARPRLQAFKQLSNSIEQLMQLQQMLVRLAPAAAAATTAAEPAADGMQQRLRPGIQNGGLPSGFEGPGQWHAFAAAGQAQVPSSPWDNLEVVKNLVSVIGPQLAACGALIGDVLDLASPPAEGCLVLPGVCEALDQLKATHTALPELLTQVVESELLRVPASVARRYSRQLWSVVYIPQVGFVMSVTGGRLPEELAELLPDYSLAFMGEDGPAAGEDETLDRCCAYYYCNCTKQLNSQYGDLQHKIQDLETSICTELIKRLLEFGPCLAAVAAAVAELDCLTSFAAAARELGYVRPTLTQDSVLVIEGGRHPLTELLAEGRFIPNDTRLGVPNTPPSSKTSAVQEGQQTTSGQGSCGPRMLLITGPNASGKSVYMKQVALIVYLAHVGSFVPAKRAVVGLTDRILTRLPGCNLESVSQHTSSFMADLGQISTILQRATSRSLILLDEFGKGTLTSDGVGLLAAILQHYVAQPVPPILLACTHFAELLAPDILPHHPQLHFCTMQVLLSGRSVDAQDGAAAEGDGADFQHDGEHVFLYKLVQGKVAASYGLHCARICGVDNAVLVRAGDVMALHQAGHAVSRLQLPQLEQRDEQYWKLVQQLAALNVQDEAAVKRLLGAMVAVEAGGA